MASFSQVEIIILIRGSCEWERYSPLVSVTTNKNA